jgi:hypothetical protein
MLSSNSLVRVLVILATGASNSNFIGLVLVMSAKVLLVQILVYRAGNQQQMKIKFHG